VNLVEAAFTGTGCAVDPWGRPLTDHENVTAPPSGSDPAPPSVTVVPTVVAASPGQLTAGGNTGQTPSSSALPSQSSSSPLHTSFAGPTPPAHGPHCPASVQVCLPSLHCPTSMPHGWVCPLTQPQPSSS
jgi:hypothetical protein